jgi:hypothetical protein
VSGRCVFRCYLGCRVRFGLELSCRVLVVAAPLLVLLCGVGCDTPTVVGYLGGAYVSAHQDTEVNPTLSAGSHGIFFN